MRKWLFGVALIGSLASTGALPLAQKDTTAKRPKLSLRARPEIGIAPMRVVFTAELEGGSDDFEDYYCPTIIWEWRDGSSSESSSDCEPFEAGKSKIVRRYTKEHTYRMSGTRRVYFSIRHREKEVAAAGVNIVVQPGGTDNSEY